MEHTFERRNLHNVRTPTHQAKTAFLRIGAHKVLLLEGKEEMNATRPLSSELINLNCHFCCHFTCLPSIT